MDAAEAALHPIALIFTSGTTGSPKGVPLPLSSLESIEVYMREGLGVGHAARFWNAADAGWAYGLYYNVYGTLLLGHTAHLLPGAFCPLTTIDFMARHRITHLAAAPTVYRALRAAGEIVPGSLALQAASSAGDPLPPAVSAWFERDFGIPILDHYGQSESGMMCLHHHTRVKRPLQKAAPMRTWARRWVCRCVALTSSSSRLTEQPSSRSQG